MLAPLLGLLLAVAPARADRQPPDYRAELHRAAAARAEALNAEGRYQEAVELARRYQKGVEPAADVAYEAAYALNRMAKLDEALDAYDEVLKLDPEHAAAHYDRGELLLALGRPEKARADLEAAARLRPDHWVAHFRLAELAGRDGDVIAFEDHLMAALRQGFDLRTLLADPTWRSWFRDPRLGPVLRKLVIVYGDERMLEGL